MVGARVPRQARALVPTWGQARAARREMGLSGRLADDPRREPVSWLPRRCSSPFLSAEPFLRLCGDTAARTKARRGGAGRREV